MGLYVCVNNLILVPDLNLCVCTQSPSVLVGLNVCFPAAATAQRRSMSFLRLAELEPNVAIDIGFCL